jgi:uncharacterized protein (DUF302 family)
MSHEIGFEVHSNLSFEEALEKVTQALKSQGFGVLTRIDVHQTLKEKLGEEFRPYVILGACNPPLAHRALMADPIIGLMLPCNVTVEADPAGGVMTRIANPVVMLKIGPKANPELTAVAREAKARLEKVAEILLQASE